MAVFYSSPFFKNGYAPIGILTFNRPALLDLTLRSLCASDLPEGIRVVIYDDASNETPAIDYLYTNKAIAGISSLTPIKLGTDTPVVTLNKNVGGIHGSIQVSRSKSHMGVFHGSLRALYHFLKTTDAPYLCLVQDDVIFAQDWYLKMSNVAAYERPGVLAGLAFGSAACRRCKLSKKGAVISSFVQASCLFLSRELLISALPKMLTIEKSRMRGFDTLICDIARQVGANILLMCPNVCQHVGVLSLVRPERSYDRKKGRYSSCIQNLASVAGEVNRL